MQPFSRFLPFLLLNLVIRSFNIVISYQRGLLPLKHQRAIKAIKYVVLRQVYTHTLDLH